MTKYLESYRQGGTSERDVPNQFIKENMGLLHKIAKIIFGKNNTMADYEDVFTDCVLSVYDVFERSKTCDLSVIKNEVNWIAQGIYFSTLEKVWDFHSGASINFNTMKSKRRADDGAMPIDLYPLSLSGKTDNEDDNDVSIFVASTDGSPEDIALSKEMTEQLKSVWLELTEEEQSLLSKLYFGEEQKSLKDVGEETGVPKSTVFFMERRALDKFRNSLGMTQNENGRYVTA